MQSPWFNCLHSRPDAKIRLIAFPWCGGGSQLYARWGADLGKFIEVVGIRLPGRETRGSEPFISDINDLVKTVGEEIMKHYADKPLAFFGHSLGCVLCFEVANYLKFHHDVEPRHIFFSSEFAPHSQHNKDRLKETPLHELTDDELIKRIASHGGTPKTFIENREFMTKTFLPPYRADFKMVAKYTCDLSDLNGAKPFACGITAVEGKKDVDHNMQEFKDLTTGKFHQMQFAGGHFHLLKEENARKLKDHIKRTLTSL